MSTRKTGHSSLRTRPKRNSSSLAQPPRAVFLSAIFAGLFELNPAGSVHKHQNQVAGFEGFVDLLQHAPVKLGAGLVHAGGIDENDLRGWMRSLARCNLDYADDAVAGGLRLGRDDCDLFAGEGIEERAFADVGTAENGNKSGFQWAVLLHSYYRG